jgi:hypothetical protein
MFSANSLDKKLLYEPSKLWPSGKSLRPRGLLVSGSSHVVTHMMATGGLHGR